MSKEQDKLKIESLKVSSFVMDLDEEAQAIRGGDVNTEYSRAFCQSGWSFVGCIPTKQ